MGSIINDQLKSVDDKDKLLSSIKKMFKEFSSYFGITQEEFDSIVLEEIDNSKLYDDERISYSDFLLKKINLRLTSKVIDLLSDTEVSFELINAYIDKKLKLVKSVDDSILQFNKLSKFLNRFDFVPDLELLAKLFTNNKKFSKMVKIIMNNYMANIISGAADELFDNDILLSSIDVYCDINNITIQEKKIEIDLANVNSFYEKMKEYPLLTREQEMELSLRVAQGDIDARNLFVNSNYRLVFRIAHKYKNRGLPIDDLIQEGNVALMLAVDKFDGTKGFKFSSYATWWIRQRVSRALYNDSRNIRIPINVYEKMGIMRKKIDEAENEAGRYLSIEELSEKTGYKEKEIFTFYELQSDTLSIDERTDSGDEFSYFIPSPGLTPEQLAINGSLKDRINVIANNIHLNDKQIFILNHAFGLNDNEELNRREIGELYGVSRERGRQYVDEIVMRFRQSGYAYELAEYMGNPDAAKRYLDDYKEKLKKTNM